MILVDALSWVGYGIMLYVVGCLLAEGAKGLFRIVEQAWLNLVFHGNLTGEKRLKK